MNALDYKKIAKLIKKTPKTGYCNYFKCIRSYMIHNPPPNGVSYSEFFFYISEELGMGLAYDKKNDQLFLKTQDNQIVKYHPILGIQEK